MWSRKGRKSRIDFCGCEKPRLKDMPFRLRLRNTQNIQIWNVPETAEEQKKSREKKDEDFINCSTML